MPTSRPPLPLRFNHRRLQRALDEEGLSRMQLANAVGAHYTTVSNWATGRNTPVAGYVLGIADVLGCDPAWLYEHDDATVSAA